MADRFPSLEEFDSGAAEVPGNSGLPETGAEDDFLTREKALLGDDANQFATGNENTVTVEDGDDDLLGGGEGSGGAEVTEFESSFPAIDTQNEAVAPGGTITGSATFTPSYQHTPKRKKNPKSSSNGVSAEILLCRTAMKDLNSEKRRLSKPRNRTLMISTRTTTQRRKRPSLKLVVKPRSF